MKQLMTYNPSDRIDAVAALGHSFFSQAASQAGASRGRNSSDS